MSSEVSKCVIDDNGYKVLEIRARAGEDPTILVQLSAEASANVFHSIGVGKGLETAEFEAFGAKVCVSDGAAGPFVGASAHLIDAKASIFDVKLGIGVDTGARIIDDSLQVQAMGIGVTLGRKVGISVLGSSFGVDFGRLFGK